MIARQNTHHFAPFGVYTDIGAERIHHIDGFGLAQFPRTGGESIGLGGQRAHWAQINDIALKVRIEGLVQIGGNLGVFAATCLAHLGDARDLGRETHTAGAGDAACHMGFDQRPEIEIFGGALGFAVAAEIHAIGHGLILQITLAALIANRAIQRVVDE